MKSQLSQIAGLAKTGMSSRKAKYDAGQSNLVELMIGLLLAGIIAMAVFIPVWTDVLNDVTDNLSATQTTIAELIPLFVIILILVAAVAPLRRRFN